MEAINIKAYTADTSQIDAIKAFMKALKIKFEVAEESPYNPEFVAKIEKSRKQAKEGKTVKITLDEIWK
jgi:cytochrome c